VGGNKPCILHHAYASRSGPARTQASGTVYTPPRKAIYTVCGGSLPAVTSRGCRRLRHTHTPELWRGAAGLCARVRALCSCWCCQILLHYTYTHTVHPPFSSSLQTMPHILFRPRPVLRTTPAIPHHVTCHRIPHHRHTYYCIHIEGSG